MTRLLPRLPGQATGTAARQAFPGSDGGRVRNASPVRGGRPGTPVAAAAAAASPVWLSDAQAVMSPGHMVEYVLVGSTIEVYRDKISLPALHVMDNVPWSGQETWSGTAFLYTDDNGHHWIVTVFPITTPS